MLQGIKIEDTLLLTRKEGFPEDINLERHLQIPCLSVQEFEETDFPFRVIGVHEYHEQPRHVFLAEKIKKKKLYWGHAQITSQSIDGKYTRGTFRVIKIYSPVYQFHFQCEEVDRREAYHYPHPMDERILDLLITQYRTVGSVLHRQKEKRRAE